MGEYFKEALRAIANTLEIPVIIILLLLIILTVVQVGIIISEYFNERKTLTAKIPELLDEMQDKNNLEKTIENSGILRRQKDALLELTKHKEFSDNTLDALAMRQLEEEQAFYTKRIKSSDLIARLGPMLGLLGTLIPLGPGIVALSRGDVTTLSMSLSTAFDTTIAGLACASFAYVISSIRKTWYGNYMSMLEALMEGVLEVEKGAKTE